MSERYARDACEEAWNRFSKSATHQRALEQELERIEVEGERIYDSQRGFNYIKFHLPLHYGDHIREYRNIPGFSTDIGELAHVQQLKVGYRKSNKNNMNLQIL